MKPFHPIDANEIAYFQRALPGRVFTGEAISVDYDHDEMTEYGHFMPEAVLQALTTEDVAAVLAYCNDRNIAVTPRGAGGRPQTGREVRHAIRCAAGRRGRHAV